jgi:hypothetical protein
VISSTRSKGSSPNGSGPMGAEPAVLILALLEAVKRLTDG